MQIEDGVKVEVLHQKGDMSLVRLVPASPDELVRFGVMECNELQMVGTKSEAKKFYGNWKHM